MTEKRYIRAPENDFFSGYAPTIFLGGGISNCPDWQLIAAEYLLSFTNYRVYNPRRVEAFDIDDAQAAPIQIKWEFDRLIIPQVYILFWFPKETLCPITLFEYGKALGSGHNRIFVGCHEEYQRKLDLIEQTKLMNTLRNTKVVLHFDLDPLLRYVENYEKD